MALCLDLQQVFVDHMWLAQWSSAQRQRAVSDQSRTPFRRSSCCRDRGHHRCRCAAAKSTDRDRHRAGHAVAPFCAAVARFYGWPLCHGPMIRSSGAGIETMKTTGPMIRTAAAPDDYEPFPIGPQNLRVTNVTNTSISVRWDRPFPGASESYAVNLFPSGLAPRTQCSTTAGTANTKRASTTSNRGRTMSCGSPMKAPSRRRRGCQ